MNFFLLEYLLLNNFLTAAIKEFTFTTIKLFFPSLLTTNLLCSITSDEPKDSKTAVLQNIKLCIFFVRVCVRLRTDVTRKK